MGTPCRPDGQAATPTPPAVDFTYTPNGLTVTFKNGTKEPATWAWDFGDGLTATIRNPVHTYAAAGTYSVTLTATATSGATASVTKSVTVTP